jgi:hypothetical protein
MIYNNNNFFHIDKYYIYIYINNNNHKYNFDIIDNNLFLFITNKNKNDSENFKLKIMYDNKECYLKYKDIKDNIVKIGLLENLIFNDTVDFSNILELGNNYSIYEINKNSKCDYILNGNNLHIVKKNNNEENIKIIIYHKLLLKQKLFLLYDFNENNEIIFENLDTYFKDDIININNIYLENNYKKIYNNLDLNYYAYNNNNINEHDKNNIKFLLYHWYFLGKNNQNHYFKYLLKKHEYIIKNLAYPKIKYVKKNKNTLLFVDDRYDISFIYLLQLFLYSVDKSWNINVITTNENKKYYENDFKKLGINGKISTLTQKFKNIGEYTNLLRNHNFWKNIEEDNVLLFQYDSFCMGKFDPVFYNYNYLGSQWDHHASIFHNILIGNGGTSFRKTRIMEYLCEKYQNKEIKKYYPEDVFFSELLYEEKLYNYDLEIANKFAFENIYSDFSIYAHQIYKSVSMENMDNFMYEKISKM